MARLCFDVETSTKNKGNPFTASNKMVSLVVKVDDDTPSFHYFKDLGWLDTFRQAMSNATLIIGFNLKFDLHWARRYGIQPPDKCRIWDCQIAEFIINGQKGSYPSLEECCIKYGIGRKQDQVAKYWDLGIDTEDIPLEVLTEYNIQDVELTHCLRLKQLEVMSRDQVRLCTVMGLDLLVLEEMEWNGVKFDSEVCKKKSIETEVELSAITAELLNYSPTPDINLDSGQQLSCLLYGGKFDVDYITEEEAVYKSGPKKGTTYVKNVHNVVVYECPRLFEPLPKSETKLKKKIGDEEITIYVTNEDTLKQLKAKDKWRKRLIELLLKRAELAKLQDTYYSALPLLLNEMEWGDIIHPTYNQCVTKTGRLSSSKPNAQNFSGTVDQLIISRYQ